MEVRLQSVRKETLSRACESIFTRVICAHVTSRRKEHGPESDSSAKLYGSAAVRERIEPEHGAIDLPLPCCAGEWATIKRCSIEIPGFKCIWLFGRREQAKSCRDRSRRISTWWRCTSCEAWQRAR